MKRIDRKPVAPVLRSWGRGPLDPLPLALNGHEEGVHDLRVAARRFRTVLPILARTPRRARIRRAIGLLRQIGDLAGVSRDCDVKLGLLAPTDDSPAAHLALLERLRETRARAYTLLASGLHALDLSSVQGLLGAVAAEDPEPLFVVLTRLSLRRDELLHDIRARLARAARFNADGLHRLRIRIRRLRYLADMYGEIRGLPLPAPGLKRLQDALGKIQDSWVLSRWLAREASLARRRGHDRLAAYARDESKRWRDAAREHHCTFLASRPEHELLESFTALGGSLEPRARGGPKGVAPVSPHRRKHKQSA
jgi:CHAD domain-containing protein